ncbi:MAG: hypothetical protein ACR2OA_07675 [Rubripirellula sp.]
MSDSKQARDERKTHDPTVMDAVRSNTDLLHTLLAQLTDVQLLVNASCCGDQKPDTGETGDSGSQTSVSEGQMESGRLRQKIQQLESENAELHS